jgi:phage-related protein
MDENYIGVAMGMDVTDLKAGISEANKQIQLANSEFKAASSGMDDWTKSTEGITAKVKQLDSVLQMQKSKLAGLTAEYEKVAAEQGEGSEAARKLKVQINNQQSVVNKTEKEFNDYSDILQQVEAGTLDLEKVTIRGGKAVEDMGNKAEASGGKLDGLKTIAGGIGKGLLAVGAAAAGAVGGFLSLAESTRETRENMAKLETGFTTAGHSAEAASETYKDLYAVLGDEGQATEAAAHLALLANNQEDLTKWTDIATGVYATFGDSLPIENLTEAANETAKTGKITGGLADALNWAGVSEEEFQAKLDAATSEQERQALITDTLNGLYAEQSAQFKELNGDIMSAREADAALAETMAELGAIAEPIMTTLKVLAVDLLNSIKPFVELLGTGLQGVLEGNAGAAETMAEGLSGIIGSLVGTISSMLPTVLSVFSQLVPMLLTTLSEQLPTIIEAIATFLPQIISTVLDMLPLLLETLVSLVIQIVNALAEMLPTVVEKIMEILPVLIEQLISAIPQLIQAAVTLLMAIVQALPTIINSLIAALPSVITTIINALIQSIPILLDAAIQLLNAIIQAIPTIIQALITNLPLIIDAIITGVLDALPLLLDAAITLFFAILDALPVIIKELVRALPQISATVISALVKAIPSILKTAGQLFGKILSAAGDLIKQLPSRMREIITSITSGLKEGIAKVKEIGSDIIKGLWNGIKDMASWIGEKIKGFGESVLGGIKSFFGIKSPSRLMRKEVGQWIGKGIGVGILDSIPAVKKNVDKFSNFVSDNIGNIKAGLSLDSDLAYAGATGGRGKTGRNGNGGYTVVNAGMTVNYNGTLSRKELKRIETDHYTTVKTKLKQEGAI